MDRAMMTVMCCMNPLPPWEEEPTAVIPVETMRELVFGEGHAPVGPSRPTRDLRRPDHQDKPGDPPSSP